MPNPKNISDVLGYLKGIDDKECEIQKLEATINFQYESMGKIAKNEETRKNRLTERIAEMRDHLLLYPEEDIVAAMKQFEPKSKKQCK
jgi:hypothetical protein